MSGYATNQELDFRDNPLLGERGGDLAEVSSGSTFVVPEAEEAYDARSQLLIGSPVARWVRCSLLEAQCGACSYSLFS